MAVARQKTETTRRMRTGIYEGAEGEAGSCKEERVEDRPDRREQGRRTERGPVNQAQTKEEPARLDLSGQMGTGR